jgi:hypothetical protein
MRVPVVCIHVLTMCVCIRTYIHVYQCDYWQGLDRRLDLLTTLTHDLWLRLLMASSLISTVYKLLQHTLSLFSLLCLHQSFRSNGIKQRRLFSFSAHFFARWLSSASSKSSRHRLPYNCNKP